MSTIPTRIYQTLVELIGLPSTSGHEELVRTYLEQRLVALGLSSQVDAAGNLIALLPGEGHPLLLNAHMDRVPPGLAHTPILRDGVLYSDGKTNLGADDAAGIAIVLELLDRIVEEHLPHPPLVLVFTVQEEVGLQGASAFDPTPWGASAGIVSTMLLRLAWLFRRGQRMSLSTLRLAGVQVILAKIFPRPSMPWRSSTWLSILMVH